MLIKNVLKKLANTTAATVLVLSQTLAYSAGFFITNPALAGALTSASIVPTTTAAPNNWNTNTVANIQTSNNVYVSEVGGGSQGYSGFDFSIPAGSVIDGIEITVEAKSSTGVACRPLRARRAVTARRPRSTAARAEATHRRGTRR